MRPPRRQCKEVALRSLEPALGALYLGPGPVGRPLVLRQLVGASHVSKCGRWGYADRCRRCQGFLDGVLVQPM